jgi:hypothetical protein
MNINIYDRSHLSEKNINSITYNISEWEPIFKNYAMVCGHNPESIKVDYLSLDQLKKFNIKSEFSDKLPDLNPIIILNKKDVKNKNINDLPSEFTDSIGPRWKYTLMDEKNSPAPLLLKFNYISNHTVSKNTINFAWSNFIEQINCVVRGVEEFGKEEFFQRTMDLSIYLGEEFKNGNISEKFNRLSLYNYGGFIKNYIYDLPKLYRDFQIYKNFPIFMKPIVKTNESNLSDGRYSLTQTFGFDTVLINDMYFSNSPLDMVIGGSFLEQDTKLPTIEKLCEYIFENLKLSSDEHSMNIVINRNKDFELRYQTSDPRNNIVRSLFTLTEYKEMCSSGNPIILNANRAHHIEKIQINKIEENYYENAMSKLYTWRNIFDIIIDFDIKSSKELEPYKKLFDKIVTEGQKFI